MLRATMPQQSASARMDGRDLSSMKNRQQKIEAREKDSGSPLKMMSNKKRLALLLVATLGFLLQAAVLGASGESAADQPLAAILRDISSGETMSNNDQDGAAGTAISEEQVPSLVVPSSLINNNRMSPNLASANNLRSNRLLAVPNSLTRFLFANMRIPTPLVDRAMAAQATASLNGYKRSSSALDSLTGVTLGKRSVSSPSSQGPSQRALELVNYEPILSRHSAAFLRTAPRMYDVARHWTGTYDFGPFESQADLIGSSD